VGVGDTAATGEVAAVVVVLVAGDIALVAGVVPAIGEIPGAAGLIAVTGGTAGAVMGAVAGLTAAGLIAVVGGAPGGLFAGDVGGAWPNEVSARVMEQRLAISSVFIGLIGKFFPSSNSDELDILFKEISASRAKLSRVSFRRFGGATKLVRIILPRGM
jgi:hypothetical protein